MIARKKIILDDTAKDQNGNYEISLESLIKEIDLSDYQVVMGWDITTKSKIIQINLNNIKKSQFKEVIETLLNHNFVITKE